ncbi:hypothetical protein, partial [Acidovorax sp. Root217]|uniref:hypothetical protein n=1 Tax=Acidovorax sp. Root217 TaxID=1736492 RepID=UPI001F46B708
FKFRQTFWKFLKPLGVFIYLQYFEALTTFRRPALLSAAFDCIPSFCSLFSKDPTFCKVRFGLPKLPKALPEAALSADRLL